MTAANFNMQEFVSIVSHDLRAPIRHMRQFSTMLAESLTAPTEEQQQYVEFIQRSSQQCGQMMEALTELSRLHAQPPEAVPIDFAALFTEACDELAARNDCQPTFSLNDSADGQPLMDVLHARTLLHALADNAFKFRRQGHDLALQLDIANVNGQQVVKLTDNGIGIAPNFINHCTTLFKQLDKNLGGVGKGLTLVENIAHMYRGSVTISSDMTDGQQGTTVTVILPLIN